MFRNYSLNRKKENNLPLAYSSPILTINFRKPSDSAIPEPFYMATCLSFYNAVENLDAYSTFCYLSTLDSSKM